jgi:hypothetical protein
MPESLKRVARLIEIGTIAIKTGPDMGKMNLAIQDSGIRILVLVKMQHIGMHQIDTLILYPRCASRSLTSLTVLLGISETEAKQQYYYKKIK